MEVLAVREVLCEVICFQHFFTSMNAPGIVLSNMARLQIIVKNFSRTTAISFKNNLGSLSILTVSDASMFFKIFSIYSIYLSRKLRFLVNPNI